MSRLIAMCGIPGAGKSTISGKIIAENPDFVYISTDKIRGELFGNEGSQADNVKVFDCAYKRTNEALLAGKTVVFDATLITQYQRKLLLDACGDAASYKEIRFVSTRISDCKRRNKARERVVPNSYLNTMYSRLQFPTTDEGWDAIKVIRN